MKTTLYMVKTRFLGTDGPSYFYFDTEEKAKDYLKTLENGAAYAVTFLSNYKLNYTDGCSYNDLTYGNFDAKRVLRKMV